jgi:hypothetical protein
VNLRNISALAGAIAFWLTAVPCRADMLVNPSYNVTLTSLGSVTLPNGADTTGTYQALSFTGQNLVLADWNPVQMSYPNDEILWQVPLNRNGSGQISGLGTSTAFATVNTTDNAGPAYSSIVVGGLVTPTAGISFYTASVFGGQGYIGQYNGSTSLATAISDPRNAAAQIMGLGYLPVNGSSQLVATFSDGNWYLVTVGTVNNGFYSVSIDTGSLLDQGIDATSFAYLPKNAGAGFANNGVLIGDATSGKLRYYALASNGTLSPAGNCPAISGDSQPCVVYTLGSGASPGFGVARDPVTGNVLLTTGNSQIWEMQFGAPEPSTIVLAVLCGLLFWWRARSVTAPRA